MKLEIGMIVDVESQEKQNSKAFSGSVVTLLDDGAVVRVLGAFGSGSHLIPNSRIHPRFSLIEDANKFTPTTKLW
jgi:hypothetical protein